MSSVWGFLKGSNVLRRTNKLIMGSHCRHAFFPGEGSCFLLRQKKCCQGQGDICSVPISVKTVNTIKAQRRKLLLRAIEPMLGSVYPGLGIGLHKGQRTGWFLLMEKSKGCGGRSSEKALLGRDVWVGIAWESKPFSGSLLLRNCDSLRPSSWPG